MNDAMTETGAVGGRLSWGDLFSWAVRVFKAPGGLFSGLAKTGGYGTPALYALFWLFLSGVVELAVARFRPAPFRFSAGVETLWLFLGPLLLLAVGFLVSGLFFVIWHLMGSRENYQTAFRCWAVTTPVAVASAALGVVPFLNLLGFLYGIFLLVVASRQVHGLPSRRSWIVWGVLGGLILALLAVSLVFRDRPSLPAIDEMTAVEGVLEIPEAPGVPPVVEQPTPEPLAAQPAPSAPAQPE